MLNTKCLSRIRPGFAWVSILVLATVSMASRSQAQVLSGNTGGDRYGQSVAWAGDVNNDGFDDFLVGIPEASLTSGRVGQVELYLGRFGELPQTPARIYDGEGAGDEFGYAVSAAGDVNNDGYDDFLIGAPGSDAAGSAAGKVYLYLGGATPPSSSARSWTGGASGERFGMSLAGGFDFNDDNRDDFAVGAPEFSASGFRAGRVAVYLGASTPGGITNPYSFVGDQANWRLGHSLDSAGDVNNDTNDDLIAGAPQTDFNPGRAVIWLGQDSTSPAPARIELVGEVGGDQFGTAVSGGGDLDGDDFDDVLVGAPLHDSNGGDKGSIYLYFGASIVNGVHDWKATGSVSQDFLGSAIDGGFDYNGDGDPDFAAGAPGANTPAADAGAVRIYYGKSVPSTSGDLVLGPDSPAPGFEANDGFGTSVAFIGSFNGDTQAELLAGAPEGNSSGGATAGYVNFIYESGGYTPVRLLSFLIQPEPIGFVIRWELADPAELAGIRVDANRSGSFDPIHEGWLDPARGRYEDPSSGTPARYRLVGLSRDGQTSVLAEADAPAGMTGLLLGNPEANPFRGHLRFSVSASEGPVTVGVWDVRGREVRTLLAGVAGAGTRLLTWDGRDDQGKVMPGGIYFVRALAPGARAGFKVIRLP